MFNCTEYKEPPYAERHVRWCERSENKSRRKTHYFCFPPTLLSRYYAYLPTDGGTEQTKKVAPPRATFPSDNTPDSTLWALSLAEVGRTVLNISGSIHSQGFQLAVVGILAS